MRCSIYQQLGRLLLRPHMRSTVSNRRSSLQSPLASGWSSQTTETHINNNHPASTPQVRSKSTSTATDSLPIVSDNILRSHLPDIHIPTNIPFHEFIFSKCDEFKNSVAIEDFLTGKQYTYRQLKENSVKVASALYRKGYRKDDIMLVFSPNTVDYTVMMLACAATGIWFCAANPAFTAEELARQIHHSGAIALCSSQSLTDTVKGALVNQDFPNKVKDLFVFGESSGFQPFQTLLDDDGKCFPDVDINPVDDVFTLPYSSGTTGLPKGVMLTHHNIVANCMQAMASLPVSGDDRCIGLLPLYHIYGMVVVQLAVLCGGASVFYLPKFEPQSFLKCLQDRQVTLAHLVPPLVLFLAKSPLVSKYDITSLKRAVSAAAPLGPDITSEFQQRLSHGIIFNQAYGLTELSPVCNIDTTSSLGSIGHMVVNSLGKVVDIETNQTLGPGEEGEFCVKGPQMMKGYYNNQKATDDMIDKDGWLHTGDIGYFTPNGLIYLRDRLKELIKYKGSQVAPAELEALLLGHPEVADVAVIGVPDEVAGELPKAFVVRKLGSSVSEKELAKFVESKVSHIKRLRGGVQFIEEVPKNPSGKILRRVLRTKYL